MDAMEKKVWELERQVFQLKTLLEIAKTLSTCREQQEVYAYVLATIAGTFGARHAVALARTENQWRCMALHGLSAEQTTTIDQLLDASFDQASASRQQDLLAQCLHPGTVLDSSFTLWEHIHMRDRIAGGLFFGRKILSEPYSREDGQLLRAVVRYAANTLENISLYHELNTAREALAAENLQLRQQVKAETTRQTIIGSSPAMQRIFQNIQSFGRSDAAVLIIGETGTGKELVAKAIHYASLRANQPFVAINCTAIPETLVESEFFGIEAGTATGVRQHIGYFEQANRGTLFIDEVGDMPLNSQAKLLRTLQEQTLRRVGGLQEIKVDVRVIAATNKNIKAEIKAGRFREDLYYRLGVLELHMPSLRERREDIALLAHHFLEQTQRKIGRERVTLSPEVIAVFESYSWPGNIRELENEIERLVTLAEDGETITRAHLSPHFFEADPDLVPVEPLHPAKTLREAVDRLEARLIRQALIEARGNKSEVARRLGLSRLGLQRKMERLKISYYGDRDEFADET